MFVHRGEYLGRSPRDQVHRPESGTPPGRYTTPPDQVHPQEPGTPPGQVHHPPRGQVHPRTRYLLGPGTPPREQCMLGDTSNKPAVRILLECILVCTRHVFEKCRIANFRQLELNETKFREEIITAVVYIPGTSHRAGGI